MPTYVYTCSHGHRHEQVRMIAERDQPRPCPVCMEQGSSPVAELKRDVIASMPVHTPDAEYARPLYLDSLGVHPSQINEAKQNFPHHEFHPDGRMIVRSHSQYKRALKDLGFIDKN